MPEFVRVHADVKTMFLPGQLQGLAGLRIHFDMKIGAGEFLIDSGADRPTLIPWLRAATGYVRSDGRLYDKPAVSAAPHDLNDPGDLGVLVPADDPNFNLETAVAYHVSCELPVAGREVVFKEWDISVPSSEASVDLGGLTPGPAQEVIGVPEFVSLDMVSGVGAAGKEIARASNLAAAQVAMGGSNSGRAVFMGTASAGRSALGLTQVGDALATTASSGAARETLLVPSDYDDGLSDTRAPINGSVSAAKLDAALAALVALLEGAVTSPYFQAQPNGNVLNAHNNTDANQKVAKYGVLPYSNAGRPIYGMRVESNSGSTLVQWGGGSSTGDAVTKHEWFAASAVGTDTGTKIAELDIATGLKLTGVPFKAAASTIAYASAQFPHGVAPTSPTDGDVWTTTAGIFARINGVTRQLVSLDGTETVINKTFTSPKINSIFDATHSSRVAQFIGAASGVNYLAFCAAATGGTPSVVASGADANIGVTWQLKGGGTFAIYVDSGQAATIRAAGVDANHDLNLEGKGTGVAKTRGSEIVNLASAQLQANKTFTSIKLESGHAPASASSTGTAGQVEWDANYAYICVAANTWKRAAISSW